MAYEVELPRDVETDLDEFFQEFDEASRTDVREVVVAEVVKISVNPHLGSRFYGGPSERRLFYRFRIEIAGKTHDLQLAYRFNEQKRLVTVHGFGRVPVT